MQSYNIADIIMNYNFEVFNDKYKVLEDFKVNKFNKNSDIKVDYYLKESKELPKITGNPIFKKYDFEIYNDINTETRVYYKSDDVYAICKETSKNVFEIEIKGDNKSFKKDLLNVLNCSNFEAMLLNFSAFLLHSSFIKYNNEGIIFTAPSGTGKSTQADLWAKYKDAYIVNGDKSVLKKYENKWCGFGLPFSGTSEHCNHEMSPIRAIVVLEQSPVNKIERLDKATAIKKIMTETAINSWNENYVNRVVDLICDLVENVPVYKYACTKEENAVEYLYETLERDRIKYGK